MTKKSKEKYFYLVDSIFIQSNSITLYIDKLYVYVAQLNQNSPFDVEQIMMFFSFVSFWIFLRNE